MGETLASLVMAQRAMSVMMGARINVVPDLDERCQDLQKQLDNQSDQLTRMALTKAAAEEGLETAQDQVAQLHEEKRTMNARLQTIADAYDRLLKVNFVLRRLPGVVLEAYSARKLSRHGQLRPADMCA